MGNLTSQNAVTVSLNLYKKRFKTYFHLSLIAHLWFLIPIYGWAKYYAGIALISRLAFSEISGKTETISEAQAHIKPKLWKFWLAAILASLGFSYRAILWVILSSFFVLMLFALIGFSLPIIPPINYALRAIFSLFFLLGMVVFYAWFLLKLIGIYSPFFAYELPLAIEPDMSSSTTITRSRKLVEGLQRSVVKTIVIAVWATLPISILSFFAWAWIALFIQEATATNVEESTTTVIEQVILIIYWSIFNILMTPFWQSLKAMVYYHLRCQKEAFDLPKNLASSPFWDAGDFREVGSES